MTRVGDMPLAGRRIVFVLAGEVLGGAERGALDLARDLVVSHGADACVCALDDRPGRAREVADEYRLLWSCSPVPWVGSQARKAASVARFATHVRRLRPDVVVSATNLPNVVAGLSWRVTGANVHVWTQNDVLGTTRIGRRLFRRALQSASLVTVGAEHGRDWLVEHGADPRSVHVLPGVVTLASPRESRDAWRGRLGLADGDVAACMLAHFHSGKDHATLLDAWRVVVDEAPAGVRPVLVLAGRDAGRESQAKARAFDLDLRENVRFAGEVDDVHGLLASCELGVLSSRSELLPHAITEPMSAGLPVAGTDVPGIREAAGEPCARFLAPPGDAAALADRLLELIRSPELRARLGAANAELMQSRQSADTTSSELARRLAERL